MSGQAGNGLQQSSAGECTRAGAVAAMLGAIALAAIASSVALSLRYRTADGSPAADRGRRLRFCVAIATLISAALSAGAYWMVPLLREACSGFCSELPAKTVGLFSSYQYWIVLPLACIAGLLYIDVRSEYSERQIEIVLNGAVALIVLLNLASSAFLAAALRPLRTLGCAL